MLYNDPYFRSKFPSKIARKKKPNNYKRYTGGYACHRCGAIHDAAYLVPSMVAGVNINMLICENCIHHYL